MLDKILSSIKIWKTISIIEFILLSFLFLKILKKNKIKIDDFEKAILNDGKDKKVNMDNIINSIYKSKELYNLLKIKCHPDRFVSDPELNKIATELAKSIQENNSNYEKLLEFKAIAIEKLKIKLD